MDVARERKRLLQEFLDTFGGNEPDRFISKFDPRIQVRFTDRFNLVSVLNDLDRWVMLDLVEIVLRSDPVWLKRLDELGILAQLDALRREELEDISNLPAVKFTNRDREFKLIYDFPPLFQVWLIEAPIGYGKTKLLEEIQERNNNLRQRNTGPSGDAFLLTLPLDKKFNIVSLANNIMDVLGCKNSLQEEDSAYAIGTRMASCILGLPLGKARGTPPGFRTERRYSVEHGAEFSVLVDNAEILDDAAIADLASLISGVYQELQEKRFFDRQNRFRIFLAGRNLHVHSSAFKEIGILPKPLPLSPFAFEYVEGTVRDYSRQVERPLSPETTAATAAHIMHLTGGHPGAMAAILQKLAYEGFTAVPQCFQNNAHAYLEVIRQVTQVVVDNHLEVVSRFTEKIAKHLGDTDDLLMILESLSVFRRYGTWLLDSLIAKELIQWGGLGFQLKDILFQANFISKQSSFVLNEISRLLLATRLREKVPDGLTRFADLCKFGRTQYGNRILQPYGEPADLIAIEWLYQELQYNCYVENKKGKLLEEAILKAGDDVFELLVLGRASVDVIEGFMNALKEDWELRFLFNFFANEIGYTTNPSSELEKSIERKYLDFLKRQ